MSSTAADPRRGDGGVLSTLNRDGTRRWLRPRLSPGIFLGWRRVTGYALMLIFSLTPYLRVDGKPPVLLDLPHRRFTFFGTTFLPTDTLLVAFLLLSVFIAIFLVTALFGRVWCGWGCPQTVYLEFLYRPIERLFEGRHYRSGGRVAVHPLLRGLKYVVYLVLSAFLAHTFLAYFVGVDQLLLWIRRSPLEHPSAFAIMAATTGLMMLDFCYFREQVCTLMCPYGRLQAVLLDRKSLIISYDRKRGEPRGKIRRSRVGEPAAARSRSGDCIDCSLCVATCPTGIDIREGLQMECIGCAQCVDACDRVMDRVGRPRGLIRYSSQEAMETGRRSLVRPRVVVYPVLLALVVGLFGLTLASRTSAEVSFLRNRNMTYRLLESGEVSNVLQVKVTNRGEESRRYRIEVPQATETHSPDLPLQVGGGASASATLHVTLGRDRFERGRASITVRVTDDVEFDQAYEHRVLGPLFDTAGSKSGEDPVGREP